MIRKSNIDDIKSIANIYEKIVENESIQVMTGWQKVVDPKESGKGYATDFVSFYEAYALENGCKYLRLDTNAINVNARKLYKKLGYEEVGIVPCAFNGIKGIHLVCLEKKLA